MTTNVITLTDCTSYATEANLDRGLSKRGLDKYGEVPCRYIKCLTPEGRWTAIFLVGEYFRVNKTGGYVMFAAAHGFMSV